MVSLMAWLGAPASVWALAPESGPPANPDSLDAVAPPETSPASPEVSPEGPTTSAPVEPDETPSAGSETEPATGDPAAEPEATEAPATVTPDETETVPQEPATIGTETAVVATEPVPEGKPSRRKRHTSSEAAAAPVVEGGDFAEGWVAAAIRENKDTHRLPFLVPYGMLRLDIVFDDSPMQDPDFAQWVLSEDDDEPSTQGINNSELTFSPRLTRVGLELKPFEFQSHITIGAKVEIDFQTQQLDRDLSAAAMVERSAAAQYIRLRHAYGDFGYRWLQIRAGQTDDLISPFRPSVNQLGSLWNAGNTGDRRPQLRVTAAPEFGRVHTRFAVAAGMPNYVDRQDIDRDGQLDGVDAARPMLQGLAEVSGRLWTKQRPFIVGVWSHYSPQWVDGVDDDNPIPGSFDYDRTTELRPWSFGAHLQLPILDRLWGRGEFFVGEGLSDIRGGIGQAINNETGDELFTLGGWVEVAGQPLHWLTLTAGTSIDDPNDVGDGQRARNWTAYGAATFRPVAPLELQVEYIYWRTEYANFDNGTANRINLYAAFFF